MRYALLLALAGCGSGSVQCRGILCINPSAAVFIDVRYADGGTVASPQFSVNGSAVTASAVTQELLPDGGTAACACQQVEVPPGVDTIDVVAGSATGRVVVDAGVTQTQCCGPVVSTRVFDEQVTVQ